VAKLQSNGCHQCFCCGITAIADYRVAHGACELLLLLGLLLLLALLLLLVAQLPLELSNMQFI
jgi:hypothetical protein